MSGPAQERRPSGTGRLMTLAFVALAYALAFWQRPGWATSDTKIDLHVDPGRFLHQVASVWASTTDLGEVHSAQYSGYVWPMGPFFALLHGIGIGPWVVQRLWLGTLFALSVWGMLRLLDALIGRPRGVAHVVATAFFLLNPYTTVFTARTSITLLGYAALPWLLLVTLHGIHAGARPAPGTGRRWRLGRWRSWWWAAAFALILTSIGGGVNAAVVGWMLIGPLALLVYEPWIGNARWRDAGRFLLQVALLSVLASLWWIVPLLVHVQYGIDFLQFTEQPATIWGTNSATESLRLMGYWTSYIGVGFGVSRPFFSDGATLLFNPLVVGASLLLPALAFAGYVRSRRVSYAPLLLLLVVVGGAIMTAGFPDGTPLRGAMDWIYHHIVVLRFMRTTNKAAPLVAVGVAGLLGLGARAGLARLRTLRRRQWRRPAMFVSATLLAGLIALSALPLVRGGALDTQLGWKRIPSGWRAAGAALDRTLPANQRAIVLPGQIFAYYNWGGTLDAILPRLTGKPVAVRYETPYSDLHAVDLLTTVDDLVQQRRLVPGQLQPLLGLMGVGRVITGTDDDTSRSGSIDPAAAAGVLAGEGLGSAGRGYGPQRNLPPAPGDVGPAVRLPEVRGYDIPAGRGIVHVDPLGGPTIVDGSAGSLADLAAFGALPSTGAVRYAGDLTATQIRSAAAAGADIVVADSNRRRQFLPQSTQQNRGLTLGAADPVPVGSAVINPFPGTGTDGQTVSVLAGAAYLRAPYEPGELQFPEHGPFAAFDGDPSTAWVADRFLPVFDRWIEVGFNHPRDVPYVDVRPLSDVHGAVTEIDVNGVRRRVGGGVTRFAVNLHHVSRVRVTIDHVLEPKHLLGIPGGIREITIPGLHLRQLLRAPLITGRALAGTDTSRDALDYVFERTTGDDPFRRNPFGTTTALDTPSDRGDAEAQIDRALFAPVARRFTVQAWAYPAVSTPDSVLDRLAGYHGAATFDSSSRFQDQPAYRASAAFDGRGGAGWVGVWQRPEAPAPWLAVRLTAPRRLSRLRLVASTLMVRRPTSVAVSWPGGASGPLAVAADGTVTLPQPVRARQFRLTILQAAFPAGAGSRDRRAAAVGVGRLVLPGLPAARIPQSGRLHAPCGTVRVHLGGQIVPLSLAGTVSSLDAGSPLPAAGCRPAAMPAGIQTVTTLPGPFSVDLLRLHSPAPVPPASSGGGRVIAPGAIGTSSVTGVRVALRGPSWLVLGESYDAGWRALCDGRSLGAPQVFDGYGNGWLAPASCRDVRFDFSPQSGVRSSYVLSGLVCGLLGLFLLGGALRRPGAFRSALNRVRLPEPRSAPLPFSHALLLALPVAAVLGFMFALRAGAVALPIAVLVLWRGLGPRGAGLIAAGLMGIVVPIAYVLIDPNNRGGYNFVYSTELIWAHWVGVAVLGFAMLAVVRMVLARRRGARAQAGAGPSSSPISTARAE